MSKPLFLVLAMLVSPAIGADGGVATRGVVTSGAEKTDADVVARGATSRVTASRGNTNVSSRTTGNATRGTTSTASRTTVQRTTSADSGRSTVSRGTVARTTSSNVVSTTRSTQDMNDNPAVRRAGVVLRPAVADYGGRATIAGTGKQTGSNIRDDIQKLSSRIAEVTVTQNTISATRESLDKVAELNSTCQEQYNECMDQFCAVVDTNQKRCSCSANLSKYAKVEEAVTEANAKLNEVAQTIRYVGLSADEIRAIMTETEAEEELSGTKDTSTTRNMLEQIEKMIKDPTTTKTSYSSDTSWGFGLDMDLDFTSNSSDIFNLDFFNSNNTSNISSLRGTDLYNIAKKRCNTILTQCKNAGATHEQITGNYDLAIDRDCIAYEAGLKKMNETLVSNVNNAKLLLQKARLAVMENKNQYDARGCLAALENCMRDDMVCGDDYSRCVDPTKAYIDENGDVVLGQDITKIQSFMVNYNNANINSSYLREAYSDNASTTNCTSNGDGKCIVKYLLQKIGTKQKATEEGLCRPVLDKCQVYTYKDGEYQSYNDVVVNYIQRAMVTIKSAQQKVISDYASSCMTEVASCYNQQVSQVNSWSSAASTSNTYAIMRGACRSVALTCGLAIFSGYPKIEKNQDVVVGTTKYNVSGCKMGSTSTEATYNDDIIDCVSSIFYQSLLCPDNSTYVDTGTIDATASSNGTTKGMVNARCQCNDGYDVWSGACVPSCPAGAGRTSTGNCICQTGFTLSNGVCVNNTNGEVWGGISYNTGSNTNNTPAQSGPSNSFPTTSCTSNSSNGTVMGCVVSGYMCLSGFMSVGGSCVNACSGGASFSSNCPSSENGVLGGCATPYCKCPTDYIAINGSCMSNGCQSGISTYDSTCTGASADGTSNGCLANQCRCNSGKYVANSGTNCVDSAAAAVGPQIVTNLNSYNSGLYASLVSATGSTAIIRTADNMCLQYDITNSGYTFDAIVVCP